MFATAKTGDSHMNRLQSIQCLIVSGLGGTVIVGGRCNTRIARLAIRKIAITFLIFGRSLPIFFTNMGNVQMQHICNFEKNLSISSLSF